MQLTIKQYESAIRHVFTKKQLTILLTLFCDDKISNAIELGHRLNPSAKGHIAASGAVGKMGKAIADFHNREPELYYNKGKNVPAYFSVIGNYDSIQGWQLHANLKQTLFAIIKDSVIKQLLS